MAAKSTQRHPLISSYIYRTAEVVLVDVECPRSIAETGGTDTTLILEGTAEHSLLSLLTRCNAAPPPRVPPAMAPPGL